MYNAFWTSWPCIFTYVFERDVGRELSLKFPVLYKAGPKFYYFNFKVFWKWMGFAFFHGTMIYFFIEIADQGPHSTSGKTMSHWVISSSAFTICLVTVTMKLFIESTFLNAINLAAGVMSVFFYFVIMLLASVDFIAHNFQPELDGVLQQINYSSRITLLMFFSPIICLLPDLAYILFNKIFFPTPTDRLLLSQKAGKFN